MNCESSCKYFIPLRIWRQAAQSWCLSQHIQILWYFVFHELFGFKRICPSQHPCSGSHLHIQHLHSAEASLSPLKASEGCPGNYCHCHQSSSNTDILGIFLQRLSCETRNIFHSAFQSSITEMFCRLLGPWEPSAYAQQCLTASRTTDRIFSPLFFISHGLLWEQ